MGDDYDALLALPVRYLYLDTETTDLDVARDEITEVAWITERDGRVIEREYIVAHSQLPGKYVLESTDYITRILPAPKVHLDVALQALAADCNGAHTFLVGQNPAFDHGFLAKAYYERGWKVPYDYHLLGVEVMIMQALALDRPPRLKEQRALMGIAGENPAKHTAMADARETRMMFAELRARRPVAA